MQAYLGAGASQQEAGHLSQKAMIAVLNTTDSMLSTLLLLLGQHQQRCTERYLRGSNRLVEGQKGPLRPIMHTILK